MKALIIALAIAFPVIGFADSTQTTQPVVAEIKTTVTPPVVAAPSPAPAVVATQKVVDKIPTQVPAWIIAVIAFVIEIIMRFYPTVKPRSLFILVGQLIGLVGTGFLKISSLLDNVVQNIKEDPAKLS